MSSVESNLTDRRNTLFSLFKQSKPIASRQTKLLPSLDLSFNKRNGPEREETCSPTSTTSLSSVASYHVALYTPSVHAQDGITKKERKTKGTNGVKKSVKRGIKKIVTKVFESALEEAIEKCGRQNTKAIKKVANTKTTEKETELSDRKENINLCSLQKLVRERTEIKELCGDEEFTAKQYMTSFLTIIIGHLATRAEDTKTNIVTVTDVIAVLKELPGWNNYYGFNPSA